MHDALARGSGMEPWHYRKCRGAWGCMHDGMMNLHGVLSNVSVRWWMSEVGWGRYTCMQHEVYCSGQHPEPHEARVSSGAADRACALHDGANGMCKMIG